MSVVEKCTLFRTKDGNNNSVFIYPITKSDYVDGLEENVSSQITDHNTSDAAHADIRTDISNLNNNVANKADIEHYHNELTIDNGSRGGRVSLTSNTVGEYYLLPREVELYGGEPSVFNLGSSNNKWDNIYSDTIIATNLNGTATKATGDEKGNNIVNTYETKTAASSKLSDAKNYTDTKTSGLASTSSVNTSISNHNTSTSAHSDIRGLIASLTTKLNSFLDVDDTTTDQLSEVITLINNNKGTLESLTTSKVNVSDIVNNLTTNATNKPISAAQGVVIKSLIDDLQTEVDSHTHSISDVSGLQSALDGKAESSHGTHVTYSTTTPVMDGTASAGSASTVARSDHKHPTDTSRASKTEFDSHVSDTTAHMTTTLKNQLSSAYNHSQAVHAPSNAEKNQNAFSNIAVGSTTVSADSATDTITFVGSNVSITTDTTNDKITFSVPNASTSVKGIVQLTNSTNSTSTTTAATPNSVKQAYDLANGANSAATNVLNELSNYMPLNVELITVEDIDTICGSSIVSASEVSF